MPSFWEKRISGWNSSARKPTGGISGIAPVVTGAGFGKIFSVVLGVTLIAVASIITGGASVGAMMAFETG